LIPRADLECLPIRNRGRQGFRVLQVGVSACVLGPISDGAPSGVQVTKDDVFQALRIGVRVSLLGPIYDASEEESKLLWASQSTATIWCSPRSRSSSLNCWMISVALERTCQDRRAAYMGSWNGKMQLRLRAAGRALERTCQDRQSDGMGSGNGDAQFRHAN
jgi:hypothetical protein